MVMAFNPFHSFRKHKKLWFAILTIACMFVFVLQFGKGDFLERITSLFGGTNRTKGPYVGSVYGTKVYRKELDHDKDVANMVNGLVKSLQLSVVAYAARVKPDKDDIELRTLSTRVVDRTNLFGRASPAYDDLEVVRRMRNDLKD